MASKRMPPLPWGWLLPHHGGEAIALRAPNVTVGSADAPPSHSSAAALNQHVRVSNRFLSRLHFELHYRGGSGGGHHTTSSSAASSAAAAASVVLIHRGLNDTYLNGRRCEHDRPVPVCDDANNAAYQPDGAAAAGG